jgi:hypothetical protein
VSRNRPARLSIIARHVHPEGLTCFSHLEAGMVMDARKQPSTKEDVGS